MSVDKSNMLPFNHEPHKPTAFDKCSVCDGKLNVNATQRHRNVIDADNPEYIDIYFIGFMCGAIECSLKMRSGQQAIEFDYIAHCYSGAI